MLPGLLQLCRFLGCRRRGVNGLRWPTSEKRQGTKSRAGEAAQVPLALWGFEARADARREARRQPPRQSRPNRTARSALNTASTLPFGGAGGLMVPHGVSGIDAGGEPVRAFWNGAIKACRHEVSILITGGLGAGRCLGSLPRSNVSMTSIQPPQQGQGRA